MSPVFRLLRYLGTDSLISNPKAYDLHVSVEHPWNNGMQIIILAHWKNTHSILFNRYQNVKIYNYWKIYLLGCSVDFTSQLGFPLEQIFHGLRLIENNNQTSGLVTL